MFCKTTVSLLLLTIVAFAQPQEIRDRGGFTAQIPPHFQVTQDPAGGSVALAPGQAYTLILKSHSYSTFEAFANDANLARDGFSLVGEVRSLNSSDRCFRAARATPGGYLLADTFVTFSPHGGGTLVVALSDEKHAEAAYNTAYRVANSLRYQRPEASPWQARLSGKHLLGLYTSSGFSERTDIYLLPDRAFLFRRDSASLSANGSGHAAGSSDGNWSITPAGQLVLQFHNGNTRSYTLSARAAGNEVGLDGARYFVLDR